mmetsp:Transcript_30132/g.84171  ORF Transcript_30132/g.84171 Transcript_30132/m.84171 type:complete len:255 (-) Transcript_30132:2817-3581(-)
MHRGIPSPRSPPPRSPRRRRMRRPHRPPRRIPRCRCSPQKQGKPDPRMRVRPNRDCRRTGGPPCRTDRAGRSRGGRRTANSPPRQTRNRLRYSTGTRPCPPAGNTGPGPPRTADRTAARKWPPRTLGRTSMPECRRRPHRPRDCHILRRIRGFRTGRHPNQVRKRTPPCFLALSSFPCPCSPVFPDNRSVHRQDQCRESHSRNMVGQAAWSNIPGHCIQYPEVPRRDTREYHNFLPSNHSGKYMNKLSTARRSY